MLSPLQKLFSNHSMADEHGKNITEGLPDNSGEEGFMISGGFANSNGLYIRAGGELFFNKQNSTIADWSKENLPGNRVGIFRGKNGLLAINYDDGQILQMIDGKKNWLPIYQNFQRKDITTFFEADKGTVFIGTNTGLFKYAEGDKA